MGAFDVVFSFVTNKGLSSGSCVIGTCLSLTYANVVFCLHHALKVDRWTSVGGQGLCSFFYV